MLCNESMIQSTDMKMAHAENSWQEYLTFCEWHKALKIDLKIRIPWYHCLNCKMVWSENLSIWVVFVEDKPKISLIKLKAGNKISHTIQHWESWAKSFLTTNYCKRSGWSTSMLTKMRNKSLNNRHQSQNNEHFTHWRSFIRLQRVFGSLYPRVPKPAPLNTPSLDMDSTHNYDKAYHSKHA